MLAEIKRAHEDIEKQRKTAGEMKIEIATLKVKAGLWGALAGAIPALVIVIWLVVERLI